MHPFKNTCKKIKLPKFGLGVFFLILVTSTSFAQFTDTAKSATADPKPEIPKYHSPKKAALFSTALPGLGQVYNKKYWKVPVIYVGFGALAYSFQFNQTGYVKFRNAYKYRIDDDPSTIDDYPLYKDADLEMLQKYYHRYRDLSAIGIAALYLLNIVDASVDAHLFTFDVSDDLTFRLHPTLINTANVNHYTTGIGLNIKF